MFALILVSCLLGVDAKALYSNQPYQSYSSGIVNPGSNWKIPKPRFQDETADTSDWEFYPQLEGRYLYVPAVSGNSRQIVYGQGNTDQIVKDEPVRYGLGELGRHVVTDGTGNIQKLEPEYGMDVEELSKPEKVKPQNEDADKHAAKVKNEIPKEDYKKESNPTKYVTTPQKTNEYPEKAGPGKIEDHKKPSKMNVHGSYPEILVKDEVYEKTKQDIPKDKDYEHGVNIDYSLDFPEHQADEDNVQSYDVKSGFPVSYKQPQNSEVKSFSNDEAYSRSDSKDKVESDHEFDPEEDVELLPFSKKDKLGENCIEIKESGVDVGPFSSGKDKCLAKADKIKIKSDKGSEDEASSHKGSKDYGKTYDQSESIVNLDSHEQVRTTLSEGSSNALDSTLKSLSFNPVAPFQKFQACLTRDSQAGTCMHAQHCSTISTLDDIINNACVIEGSFIGVCCPEFPAEVAINWNGDSEEFSEETKECGRRSESVEKIGNWPWMALLVSMDTGEVFCSGVLINDDHVLTSAHCTAQFPKDQILVRVGQNNISDSEDLSGEDYDVSEIKRHNRYNRRTMRNDIALLKLTRKVPIGQFQTQVCLPDKDLYTVQQNAILVSWKSSGNGTSLPVIPNEDCEMEQGFSVPESMLCTGSRKKLEACNTDFGTPLFAKQNDKYVIFGILAWDRNQCDTKFPTVFTNVSHFAGWIKDNS